MADKAPIIDSPLDPSMRCLVPDCPDRRGGRGVCKIHYQRFLRRGVLADYPPIRTGKRPREDFIRTNVGYPRDECLMWPFGKRNERAGTVNINGVNHKAYHWMCIFVHGQAPTPGHEAAHSCGNGHLGCVNPRHVRWATRAENIADMKRHGTFRHGETASGARLTAKQVRAAFLDTRPAKAVAADLGVARETVTDIRAGKRWKATTQDLVAPKRVMGRAVGA